MAWSAWSCRGWAWALSPLATDQAPARPATGLLTRVRGPLLLAGGVTAATLALHFRDPHERGSWGLCPFSAITGGYCPGCGGLRAVNDLTNGDVLAAASSNLVFVAAVPFLVLLWARWLRSRWREEPLGDLRHPVVFSLVLLCVLVAFTVVRNLPFGSWLAP